MSTTGDIGGNIEKLKMLVRGLRYPLGELDEVGLFHGKPAALLPILHHVFLDFSKYFVKFLNDRGYEHLNSKSDLRFIEIVYRCLRHDLNYRPLLTTNQFFASGFAERKILFIQDVVRLARKTHNDLAAQRPNTEKRAAIGGIKNLEEEEKYMNAKERPKAKTTMADTIRSNAAQKVWCNESDNSGKWSNAWNEDDEPQAPPRPVTCAHEEAAFSPSGSHQNSWFLEPELENDGRGKEEEAVRELERNESNTPIGRVNSPSAREETSWAHHKHDISLTSTPHSSRPMISGNTAPRRATPRRMEEDEKKWIRMENENNIIPSGGGDTGTNTCAGGGRITRGEGDVAEEETCNTIDGHTEQSRNGNHSPGLYSQGNRRDFESIVDLLKNMQNAIERKIDNLEQTMNQNAQNVEGRLTIMEGAIKILTSQINGRDGDRTYNSAMHYPQSAGNKLMSSHQGLNFAAPHDPQRSSSSQNAPHGHIGLTDNQHSQPTTHVPSTTTRMGTYNNGTEQLQPTSSSVSIEKPNRSSKMEGTNTDKPPMGSVSTTNTLMRGRGGVGDRTAMPSLAASGNTCPTSEETDALISHLTAKFRDTQELLDKARQQHFKG